MGATKRPQNKCKSCGYTWYPRGKSLSIKCPNCGSREVSTVTSWGGILGIAFVAYAVFGSHTTPPDAAIPADAVQTTASQPYELPTATRSEASTAVVSKEEVVSRENAASTDSSKPSEIELTESQSPSPTSICKNEDNYFSRNSCMWKECEKPEFSDLQECADKKPKENNIGG